MKRSRNRVVAFGDDIAEYKRRCADGSFALGDVFAWTEGPLTIFNLGTQKTWRTKAELSAMGRRSSVGR